MDARIQMRSLILLACLAFASVEASNCWDNPAFVSCQAPYYAQFEACLATPGCDVNPICIGACAGQYQGNACTYCACVYGCEYPNGYGGNWCAEYCT